MGCLKRADVRHEPDDDYDREIVVGAEKIGQALQVADHARGMWTCPSQKATCVQEVFRALSELVKACIRCARMGGLDCLATFGIHTLQSRG